MKDINRYAITNYAAEWMDIGLELGLQYDTLKVFSTCDSKDCGPSKTPGKADYVNKGRHHLVALVHRKVEWYLTVVGLVLGNQVVQCRYLTFCTDFLLAPLTKRGQGVTPFQNHIRKA